MDIADAVLDAVVALTRRRSPDLICNGGERHHAVEEGLLLALVAAYRASRQHAGGGGEATILDALRGCVWRSQDGTLHIEWDRAREHLARLIDAPPPASTDGLANGLCGACGEVGPVRVSTFAGVATALVCVDASACQGRRLSPPPVSTDAIVCSRCQRGEPCEDAPARPRIADREKIDDAIDEWHKGGGGDDCTLAQYLGWTEEEYTAFVERGAVPVAAFVGDAPRCEHNERPQDCGPCGAADEFARYGAPVEDARPVLTGWRIGQPEDGAGSPTHYRGFADDPENAAIGAYQNGHGFKWSVWERELGRLAHGTAPDLATAKAAADAAARQWYLLPDDAPTAPDAFPRAPRDAAEREACAHSPNPDDAGDLCGALDPDTGNVCTRRPHIAANDHISGSGFRDEPATWDVLARWPTAPATTTGGEGVDNDR